LQRQRQDFLFLVCRTLNINSIVPIIHVSNEVVLIICVVYRVRKKVINMRKESELHRTRPDLVQLTTNQGELCNYPALGLEPINHRLDCDREDQITVV